MKRWLFLLAALAILGGAVTHETSRGQFPPAKSAPSPGPSDLGPGEQGATLRVPGMETPAPTPKPATPSVLQAFANSPGAGRVALPPSTVNINKDIEITPDAGAWVIFVMAYSGPEAPEMAREFVRELRTTHKQNAYVFNYGAAEKQKEFERVQKLRQEQADALRKAGIKGEILPMKVRTMRIEEQTGVLIANGYRDRDEAFHALQTIRKITPDPERVRLNMLMLYKEKEDDAARKGEPKRVAASETVFINPFTRAFAARNPAVQHGTVEPLPEVDVKLLRNINGPEPLSLFNCKKKYTLVVKQFNTQNKVLKGAKESQAFLDMFQMKEITKDYARDNAHNLGDAFRKGGMPEVYVLHTKYCSYVTVGGYDSLEDRQLITMQNLLEERFKVEAYRPLEMLPRPMPMAVPH